MTYHSNKILLGCSLSFNAILFSGMAGVARADWSDNFNGGFQQSWTFLAQDAGGTPIGSLSAVVDNDTLLLSDANNALSGGSANATGFVSESFTDVRVTGTVNPLGENDLNAEFGLIARANVLGGSGYFLNFIYVNNGVPKGQLEIVKITGGSASVVVTDLANPFTVSDSIYLEFDLFGTQLTGRAYDAPGGNVLATVNTVDGTYTSGDSGILTVIDVGNLGLPLKARYDDVSSSPFGGPADLDVDGDVDGVDLSLFFSAFTGPGGGPPANPQADLDGDGDVDGVDLSQAFSAFTGPLAPASVPEPSGLAMLALAGLLVARRRRGG